MWRGRNSRGLLTGDGDYRFLEWLEEVSILLQFCLVGKDQED